MSALVKVTIIKVLMRVDMKERYLSGVITTELVITMSHTVSLLHIPEHTHTVDRWDRRTWGRGGAVCYI